MLEQYPSYNHRSGCTQPDSFQCGKTVDRVGSVLLGRSLGSGPVGSVGRSAPLVSAPAVGRSVGRSWQAETVKQQIVQFLRLAGARASQ